MVVSCSLDENDCGMGRKCWKGAGILGTEGLNVCNDIGCNGLLHRVGKGCATAGHANFKVLSAASACMYACASRNVPITSGTICSDSCNAKAGTGGSELLFGRCRNGAYC